MSVVNGMSRTSIEVHAAVFFSHSTSTFAVEYQF
jgi:hypothetical protein